MNNTVFRTRMDRVQGEMKKRGIGLFLAGPSSNLFYLTGYAVHGDERLLLLVLPGSAEGGAAQGVRGAGAFVLANALYRDQVAGLPVDELVYWQDGEDPFALLAREIERRNWDVNRIALEPHLPAFFSLPLAERFPRSSFALGSVLTDPLRLCKDPAELDLIRQASRVSDRALAAVIGRGRYWLGKTEAQFRDVLAAELDAGGVRAWDAIVAVGANGAVPHHVTGQTLIEDGKGLLVDFGGRLEGYNTDCTRTFHFGRPGAEFEKIYNIVLEAHLAAEAAARPGNVLGDVDLAARQVIEKAGYGPCFTHRTGHGLGIDTHEGASASRGETTPIAPGMVFSIEPGIYLSGRVGVRIENLVAIGPDGPEPLHAFPRELTVI
ncbi:MAG: Xaa-Pro peptidase family protein [Treponema sp.]|jgi:Xaa-Pro dipeptidase|nr:Xaa-Pro peptidase family protein [Treponema sp.]